MHFISINLDTESFCRIYFKISNEITTFYVLIIFGIYTNPRSSFPVKAVTHYLFNVISAALIIIEGHAIRGGGVLVRAGEAYK